MPPEATNTGAANDHELLRQFTRGKEAAFEALYGRYQGLLYRFAWHMTGNSATAEEVTQEAFMQLIRHPENYDGNKGSLGGYLFGIARNLSRRALERSYSLEPASEELVEGDPADISADADLFSYLSREELLACLRKAVLALPGPYREVVVLCDLEEKTYPETAELLGCASGTVASRLHRARALLKNKLSCHRNDSCVK